MPRPGDIVYAMSAGPNGNIILEPSTVKTVQEIERTSPDGENFPDMMVTVENQRRQLQTNYAYHFMAVPYLPDVEAALDSQAS